MRILHLAPRYAPRTGGVETQVQEISERLVERGHSVTVVTADADRNLPRKETRNGVRVRRHRALTLDGAFHFAPRVTSTVRRSNSDIVHVHNVHSLPLLFGILGAKGPVVATPYYHGASASGLRNYFWYAYRPIVGAALRRVSQVTAVSDWERTRIADDFHVDADVIPIGLNRGLFEKATGREHNQPYLLCVARLEKYKGIQHVIRALPEFEDPEYNLLIAGDGPFHDELERIARKIGVEDRVTFLGTVGHEKLPAIYAGADVYLSLSSFESYGITVAEALASGTPCVVRSGSALEAWADHAACVCTSSVSPNDVLEATNEARNQTPVAESIPEWSDVVDQFITLYASLTE